MRSPALVVTLAAVICNASCGFVSEGGSVGDSSGTDEPSTTMGTTASPESSSTGLSSTTLDSTTLDSSTSATTGSSSSTSANSTTGTSSSTSSSSTTGGGRYDAEGPQMMVPVEDLVGWEECWAGSYKDDGPELTEILALCSKANLMLACRETGMPEFVVLAHAPREDVFTATSGNQTHLANGVGWYRKQGSWGFAKFGDTVMLGPCDFQDGPDRMCLGVADGALMPGARCGADQEAAFGDYERVFLHAD